MRTGSLLGKLEKRVTCQNKDLLEGKRISQRYRIKSVLQWTVHAVFCEGEDLERNRQVTIIVIDPLVIKDKEQLGKIIQNRKGYSHNNILCAEALETSNENEPFLVINNNGFKSFEEILKTTQLSLKEAVEVISQIAAGLIYYSDKHERPLLPLPDVLCVKRQPNLAVKIFDLRFANCLSQPDALMDKTMSEHQLALYTPPECISGKEPDSRSQIYTLACLLYQLLTGRPPFESDDLVELQSQHLCVSAQSLHQARPDLYLPPALETCLMKALSKEPHKRHSTLRQFQLELKQSLKHKHGVLPKWPVGAVAAAVLAITAYSFFPLGHTPEHIPEQPMQNPGDLPVDSSPQPEHPEHNSNISLPPVPANATLLGKVSLAGNDKKILSAGNYQCESLNLEGSAQLICKGKVNLWIGSQNSSTNSLSISDHARLSADGNAEDLLLYYASDAPINMSASAKLKATTHAPNALLDATGDATIQGKFSSAGQRLSDNARFID